MRSILLLFVMLSTLFLGCNKKPVIEPEPELPVEVVVLTDTSLVPVSVDFEGELIRQGIDKIGKDDGFVRYGDVKDVDSLNIRAWGYNGVIRSLKGIEYFTNLRCLILLATQQDSLDLSKNERLEYLDCQTGIDIAGVYPRMTYLNVRGCKKLEYLNCYNNLLTSLDLTQNVAMKELNFGLNKKLKRIDLSSNTLLEVLVSYGNWELASLDVSKNRKLKELYCMVSALSNLDVSMLKELVVLNVESSHAIEKLDLSQNKELSVLNIGSTKIAHMDLSLTPKVQYLDVSSAKFTTLNLFPLKDLRSLELSHSDITELDLSANERLETISLSGSALKEIDLSKNPNIKNVLCYQQKFLTSLDLCNQKNIKTCFTFQSPNLATIYTDKVPDRDNGNWKTDDWTKYVTCK